MICPLDGAYSLRGEEFSLTCAPIAPSHWLILIAALCGVIGVVTIALSRDKAALARQRGWRRVVVGLTIASGLSLAWAGLNPILTPTPETVARSLVIVVDLSDSAMRGPVGEVGTDLASWVREVAQLDAETAGVDWQGTVLAVGDGVLRLAGPAALAELAGTLDSIDRVDRPLGGRTDLEAGLWEAGALIAESGRPGSVILLSDGLETRGDAVTAATHLGRQGIPVFIIPLESGAPSFGLVAADLASSVDSGAETTIRALLANPEDAAARFRVGWSDNGGVSAVETGSQQLAPDSVAAFRRPVVFEGSGLQFGTLELAADGSVASGPPQMRRLFTLVRAPVRVLALGDADWARALPSERFQVTAIESADPTIDVSDADPSLFDVAVINALPADRLAPALATALEGAVRRGTGLLLLNGDHPLADTDPTVIQSYEQSPLAPLLPVTSDPRQIAEDPPPREIILVIDTSSSMTGWKLVQARAIGQAIIDRLSWRDTARILTFQTGVQEGLPATAMDAIGRGRAQGLLGRLVTGGGTDPTAVLGLVDRTEGGRCGMFFLSDGQFGGDWRPPGCWTTVFAIGRSLEAVNPDILAMGDVQPVDADFNAAAIQLAFFRPAPSGQHFDRGSFLPEPGGLAAHGLPDPPLALNGSAAIFARPEAEVVAIRPWPFAPVLAFHRQGEARVGVLGTAVPDIWVDTPRGAMAIESWIERLVGWQARDRYLFDLRDRGTAIDIRIILSDDAALGQEVTDIAASVRLEDGRQIALPLDPDPRLWGAFHGILPLPEGAGAFRGRLELQEQGPGAIPALQSIPIVLPAARGEVERGGGVEAWAFGVDQDRLQRIAEASGGGPIPAAERFAAASQPNEVPQTPLFPWLLLGAAVSYLGAIAIQRYSGM